MIQKKYKLIALIPARSGSKRILSKNIKILGKHPLLAYSITVAKQAGIFSKILVSTNDLLTAQIAEYYGAEVPFLRPKEFASDDSPDIDWVEHTLNELSIKGEKYDIYFILRPTSPFRTAGTIKRAWGAFISNQSADSLRAVEKCRQHPFKMWKVNGKRMKPFLQNLSTEKTPWHSRPYQSLPEIFVQNASLEIAWSSLPIEQGTISGESIIPFFTDKYEGFDINNPDDWILAEYYLRTRKGEIPKIEKNPYKNLKQDS
jgi:CMP-N,N'-diacetyllegionaminic acid synthase